MFLLTDPTLISINHIQQAQKQADSGFNDVIAQMYQETLKAQEKAKEEHIKQAKEKAVEEQRKLEEKIKQDNERARQEAEAINQARERERKNATVSNDSNPQNPNNTEAGVQAPEAPQPNTSTAIGSDWSQVSPEQASAYMSARTGVSVSTWQQIIYRESTNNPLVTNSIGCFGYLQLHPVHGNVSGMTPQQYLDTAVGVYNSQGLSAWEVVTLGMVN
nr:MAG TPA: recombination and DNA strand exchange inhibitor protein [Caudoviricetes sp.]